MEPLPAVRQYMDTTVPTLSPTTLVLDAVDFLLDHGVTGAPVVDEDGKFLSAGRRAMTASMASLQPLAG